GRLIVYSVNKDIDFYLLRHSLDILGVNFKSKYSSSEDRQNKMLSELKQIGLIDYKVL
ncbi:head protein, partial [Staphylococcus pseudintermedius]